ncbi:SRPBCC family protein [Chitinophaga vietnamensis]|uniref:SRPBCC family protein n=1 Tax=Chitinophaga vietnamensis TaxID=2593957 RepID=UPI001177B912|nr:SRPBCC family protein [Chitinophaga vietnamensis]
MNPRSLKTFLIAIGIPVLYAILLRLVFGVKTWMDLYKVMSVTFIFCLPVVVGVLTVYFSSAKRAGKLTYRLLAPWIPIFLFFAITLLTSLEGWACWIMILPLFLAGASIGGLIGAYLKFRRRNKTYVSLLVLLPFVAGPLESMVGAIPGTYKAYTYIDIKASPATIWKNVTRVRAIPAQQDKGWLTRSLGFPRPVRAELNFNGPGAYRAAIFTGGLIFHETVTEYIDQQKMVFSIKADPHEIPATTMDEHVVIGGDYFDVLNGTYELERLNETTCRLHLYSHFKLTTTFNFYASWWARWIMQDIQRNILQVEKQRAENDN